MRVFTIVCVGFPAMWVTATMPSIMAACASCGRPATISPMAYKPFSSVSMVGPTLYETAIQLGFRFFQPAIFRHGLAADGQQKLFRLQGLLLCRPCP